MHHILSVDFSAARDNFDLNVRPGMLPLRGKRRDLGKTILADVYRRLVHTFFFLFFAAKLPLNIIEIRKEYANLVKDFVRWAAILPVWMGAEG
jgi:hypothetical protein